MKSHSGLLDSIVCSTERLCEGALGFLGHRRMFRLLGLLYKSYHRLDYPMNQHLNHFVALCSTRDSAALGELALMISRCRTDQFSQLLLPAAVRLWSLLQSDMFRGGTLTSFKSPMNLCLLRVFSLCFSLFFAVL